MTQTDELGREVGRKAERFGPYQIVKGVGASRWSDRMLGIDERAAQSVVVHVRTIGGTRRAIRRELAAIEACAAAKGPHLLPVLGYGLWEPGRLAWVTPWTGSATGMTTLAGLAAMKGGRLAVGEARRAVEQVWSGVNAGRAAGLTHGPIELGDVLVDAGGQVWIENYGLGWRLEGRDLELGKRLELLSLGAALVELTTGVAPPMPGWVPGLPGVPEGWVPEGWTPEDWIRAPGQWSEEAMGAAIGAALKAEDALPALVETLKRAIGVVAEVEGAAKAKLADATTSMLKAALRGAAAKVGDFLRGR